MNKLPVFVSFYTPEYESEADGLRKTLEEFGLSYDITPVADTGNWARNCNYKPAVISAAMLKHHTGTGGPAIVWLDADARVKQRPDLFEALATGATDVAYHLLDGGELLSGTLYFGSTQYAIALVRKWAAAARKFPEQWDQVLLQQILQENPEAFVRFTLPESYVYIFDRGKLPPGDIVIEHGQASRRLRK